MDEYSSEIIYYSTNIYDSLHRITQFSEFARQWQWNQILGMLSFQFSTAHSIGEDGTNTVFVKWRPM